VKARNGAASSHVTHTVLDAVGLFVLLRINKKADMFDGSQQKVLPLDTFQVRVGEKLRTLEPVAVMCSARVRVRRGTTKLDGVLVCGCI
jgi:hypothetical protein